MSRVFAYARVSTVDQLIENQCEQIVAAGYTPKGWSLAIGMRRPCVVPTCKVSPCTPRCAAPPAVPAQFPLWPDGRLTWLSSCPQNAIDGPIQPLASEAAAFAIRHDIARP